MNIVYICTTTRENILNGLRVMEGTQFQYLSLQRGIFLLILHVELKYMFSAHCLIVNFFCTMICENIFDGLRVMEWTRFQLVGFFCSGISVLLFL